MALNVFKTVMFRFQESANQEQSQEKVCKSDIQTKSIYNIIKMLNIKYWLLHDKYKDIFYYLLTKDQAVYYSAATELWAVMRLMMIKMGVAIDANVRVSFLFVTSHIQFLYINYNELRLIMQKFDLLCLYKPD